MSEKKYLTQQLEKFIEDNPEFDYHDTPSEFCSKKIVESGMPMSFAHGWEQARLPKVEDAELERLAANYALETGNHNDGVSFIAGFKAANQKSVEEIACGFAEWIRENPVYNYVKGMWQYKNVANTLSTSELLQLFLTR